MDQQMVSTFMEVTSCDSQAVAVHHLGSCHWNLDEAINLYFNAEPPTGSFADLILPEENVPVLTKEDNYHGGDAIDGDFGDDVRAPPYYGDRSTAVVDVPSLSLSEIVPTGWPGEEAETYDAAGEARVENVVDGSQQEAHDDDAEQDDDNNSTKEDDGGGGMHGSNGEEYGAYNNDDEDYDDDMMSYIDDDDDDDAYYATLAEETDGGRPAVQPAPLKESLQELFRPPVQLMYRGTFHGAKVHAARSDRFLLVNLQTSNGAGVFPSHMQNRDLWPDEHVKKVVEDGFVFFWLRTRLETTENRHSHVDECAKVADFYRLLDAQLPAVLVLDPITGQLMAKRSGAMMPDEFLQFVDEFTKSSPSALSMPKFVEKTPPVIPEPDVGAGGEEEVAVARASYAAAVKQEPAAVYETESRTPADDEVCEQEQEIPKNSGAAGGDCSEQEHVPVPELPAEMVEVDDDEPMEDEEMYKLRIRFPDGTMVTKEFGCKRKVASLFAFCRSLHGGGQRAEEKKAIRIMRFAGRALVAIQDDDARATFEELGLNFEAVSVAYDS